MANWMHLNLNFKNPQRINKDLYLDAGQDEPSGVYKDLILYLKNVVDVLSPDLINRFFYFFEPNPHLFLALEARQAEDFALIWEKIGRVEKPEILASVEAEFNTDDESNGQAAIDFFHAGAKFAFFRISGDYKPGYFHNDAVKLVHCFSNQLFVGRDNEIGFYQRCLKGREAVVSYFSVPPEKG